MDVQFWFEYLKLFQDIWFSSDSLWDIWNWLKIFPRPDRAAAAAGLLLLHLPPLTDSCFGHSRCYYPTAGSSRCSPQDGSRRPDPITCQSGRPATEACRAQLSPHRSSCEIAETSFAGNSVPNSWVTNKPAVSVAERNKNSDNDTSYNPKHQHVFPPNQQELCCLECFHEFPLHQQEMMLLSWIPTASAGNVAFMNSHLNSRKRHLAILYGIKANSNEVEDISSADLPAGFLFMGLRPLKSWSLICMGCRT